MSAAVDFFVHIPKTAGSTLLSLIEKQYTAPATLLIRGSAPEDRPALLANLGPEIRVVAGHLHLGMAKLFPRPCRPFTMLREPIDRLLSLYYFIARVEDQPGHDALVRGELTMEKLARNQGGMQARFLAGYAPKDPVSDEVLLREAKEVLLDKMAVFGLTEHFDASLLFFNQALGWTVTGYQRENVTRNRPQARRRDPAELEMIRRHSAVDLELYRFALERFEARFAAQPPEFARQLAELRRNVTVQQCVGRMRAGWQLIQRKLGLAGPR